MSSEHRPTFEDIDAIRQDLQRLSPNLPRRDRVGEWRGQWQIDMTKAMLADWSVIQGIPQNSGKTFCASLITCWRLLDGQAGVWTYPTLRQGARVGVRRVDNWMAALEDDRGLKRIRPDAAYEKSWENGASLIVLSLDVSAKSGVQGYTLEFGFLDESHEITDYESIKAEIFSRFELAMQEGFGSVCIMGVGGAKESLIEHCKTLEDFQGHVFQAKAERIKEEYPPSASSIDRAKRNLSPAKYDQFYNLKPLSVGSRKMFPILLEDCPKVDCSLQYCIGIDVGKTTDYTIAEAWRVGASSVAEQARTYDLVDVFQVPHGLTNREQAQAIAEWGAPYRKRMIPGAATCETNGIGAALQEALEEFWPDIGGVDITDNARNLGLKSNLINELRIAAQNACLGVPHIQLGEYGGDAHEHFAGLTYEVNEIGQVTWEHSDYLSAALMAIIGT